MKSKRIINCVAGVTTAAAALWLYLFFHPRVPATDRRPHEALGELLAAEAIKLLEPGARLIVIAREVKNHTMPASEAQLDSFLRVIKKSGRGVTKTLTLKLDPLRVASVPPGDFFETMKNGRDSDVIVSFLGPPVFSEDQLSKLGGKRPRVLAVCSGAMPARIDLKKIFEQKLLSGVAVSRSDAPARLADGSKQAAFAQAFQWVTPANVGDIEKLAARN